MRRQQRHRQQLEIILEWRDASRYIKENGKEIKYASNPIIVLGKPQRDFRDSRGKWRSNIPSMDYVGWKKGEPFHMQPIQIQINTQRLARIRNYVHTERRRRQALRAKQALTWPTTQKIGKWKTRHLAAPPKKLQQAADNNAMRPIWEFRIKFRMGETAQTCSNQEEGWGRAPRIEETVK